ncbi:UDP-N-acetylmuramoyl-L-alanine--D-glutamate ligase [Candidatus Parcubacteria bacterium]|nr:UDP-N-acetylmuramoyl-L-alanine--D-glutamate ligase [Candidatus Parcubacteria bacterium]
MSKLNLKNLKNKNIHIVGIGGAEGSAIAEFLVGNNISSITGHDFSLRKDFKDAFYKTHLSLKLDEREKALNHLLNLPIKINFKDHYLEGIEEADLVFVSQVWFKYPQNMPILQDLRNSGTPFKTITNLYFEFAPCKIISITGTNGKTTTARLINNIFENWIDDGVHSLECKNIILNFAYRLKPELQPKIYFAGNDRQNVQVLDKLNEMSENDVLILETSSTQLLLNSGISPHIGIITNITPNHLDDHGSFENYIEAKKNLIKYQNKEDFAVLNYDDDVVRKIAEEHNKSKVFLFSKRTVQNGSTALRGLWSQHDGCFIRNEKIIIKFNKKELVICNVGDIKIPGKHNLENVLAAVSAAYLYGVDLKNIKKGIMNYTGIKHRLKLLYNINEIKYYDDTQATTPEATIAGIESFNNDIILLAGGDDKGMNYENLARKINKEAKLLVLFPGSASDKIEKLIDESKVDFIKVEDFSEAINVLKDYYKKAAILKDTAVLISPAAAYFYSKFVEGSGKDLREWIKLLK